MKANAARPEQAGGTAVAPSPDTRLPGPSSRSGGACRPGHPRTEIGRIAVFRSGFKAVRARYRCPRARRRAAAKRAPPFDRSGSDRATSGHPARRLNRGATTGLVRRRAHAGSAQTESNRRSSGSTARQTCSRGPEPRLVARPARDRSADLDLGLERTLRFLGSRRAFGRRPGPGCYRHHHRELDPQLVQGADLFVDGADP